MADATSEKDVLSVLGLLVNEYDGGLSAWRYRALGRASGGW
jgi:hypothetical protein